MANFADSLNVELGTLLLLMADFAGLSDDGQRTVVELVAIQTAGRPEKARQLQGAACAVERWRSRWGRGDADAQAEARAIARTLLVLARALSEGGDCRLCLLADDYIGGLKMDGFAMKDAELLERVVDDSLAGVSSARLVSDGVNTHVFLPGCGGASLCGRKDIVPTLVVDRTLPNLAISPLQGRGDPCAACAERAATLLQQLPVVAARGIERRMINADRNVGL